MYEEQYLIQIIKYLLNSDSTERAFPCPPEGLKWNEVMRIADRHSVGSLLYHVMPELSKKRHFSKDVIDSMRKKAMHAAVIDIKQQVESEELLNRFEENGLFCMPVKGVNTKGYYLKSEWRTMGDIDILYKPEQHKEVKALLLEMGYTGFESGLKHDHYSKKPFITLEMHRGLVAANTLAESYYSDVWEKARLREGYNYVYQMSLEEQYIYTMVHLLEHFKNGGVGIRFIMDVYVFGKQEKLNKQYVANRFKELGILKFASYIEQLAQKWFGDFECEGDVDNDDFFSAIESFIVENGIYGQSSHARDIAIEREGRKGYFKRMVFPNYNSMVTLYPWLSQYRYLLPAAWVIRIIRTILFRKGSIQTGMRTLQYGNTQRGKALLEFYRKCGIEDTTTSIEEGCLQVENVAEIDEEEHLEKNALDFMQILKYVIQPSKVVGLSQLNESVDWEQLENISKNHNLFALFHEGACQYPEYRKKANYEDNINSVMTMVGQQIRKTEAFLELYRAFLKEDLRPIVMKGIICRQLYGKNSEKRPSGDEDILVRVNEFHRIKKVLEEKGYVCEFETITEAQLEHMQHISFYDNKNGFLIEVHTNPMGYRNDMRTQMNNFFKTAFEHARIETIKGVPIYTFSHTDHFLYLILHSLKHFAEGGVGIRQMLDVLMYQDKYEKEIDWEILGEKLREAHAEKYLGDMQCIGTRYLGFEFGVHFEKGDPDTLLNDMMESGVFGKKERADIVAANITLEALNHKEKGIYAWFRAGFPSRKLMLDFAPHLEEKPWLVPVEWVKRWGRFLKRARKYDGNLMLDSVKKSKKRMELLKKYGL